MKSVVLILRLGGSAIEIIEHPLLSKPWPDEEGKLAYRLLLDKNEDKVYVHNIYAYAFGVFGITDGARMCCSIAKKHLETLIDNMTNA